MSHIIIYNCQKHEKAWDTKEKFLEHAKKNGCSKARVLKLPSKEWEKIKEKYPEEDTI